MKAYFFVTRVYQVMSLIDAQPEEAAQMIGWVTAAIKKQPLPPLEVWQQNWIGDVIGRLPERRKDRLAVLEGVTEIVETFARPKLQRPPPKRQRKAAA